MNKSNSKELKQYEYSLDELEAMETYWLNDLNEDIEGLDELRADFEKIGSTEALGESIRKAVWEQFMLQLGVEQGLEAKSSNDGRDFSQETMDKARDGSGDIVDRFVIDRKVKKHNTSYEDDRRETDRDPKFVDYKLEVNKQRLENDSKIYDEYTGKEISGSTKHNVDHVIPVKIIHDDNARKLAGIETKDLANQRENFAVTNENLNKSKKAQSNLEYVAKHKQRQETLKQNLEQKIINIQNSNKPESEKKHLIEKVKKVYSNKYDANEKLMIEKHVVADKKINNDIKEVIDKSTEGKILKLKEQTKTATKAGLRAVLLSMLADFLKTIIRKLVNWLAKGEKTFKTFLGQFKNAWNEFWRDFKNKLKNAGTTLISTIASAIFGPIVSIFTKAWTLLKEGWKSLKGAIAYFRDSANKDKPLGIKILQVSKIIIGGLSGVGSILLGELIEKNLLAIGLVIQIPLLGSLASILGMFLGAVVSGILGAVILKKIDEKIAQKLKTESVKQQIDKGNEIIHKQNVLINITQERVEQTKNKVASSIIQRHQEAHKIMNHLHSRITDNVVEMERNKNAIKNNNATIKEISNVIKNNRATDVCLKSENEQKINEIFNDLNNL